MPKTPIPDISPNQMCQTQEIHCPECGRFIGFQGIVWGAVKLKCSNSKCGEWITLDINPENKEETRRY